MEYFIGERLCCESTRPNTYITPVFERVDGDKLRIHHIEAGALGDYIKFVPLRHVSKKRRRVFDLEDENARLRGKLESLRPTDCEGNELNIADTVHMLRSEHDGDHEWDDVVVELALAEWGGDRWIVRGSKGEAWACDCEKTGHDQEAYEASGDADEISVPSLLESENARLKHHLLSIMRGMRDAWCAEHDSLTCKECPMHKDEDTCGWTDAYDLIKELGLLDALYE